LNEPLRVAVIGVGKMGALHARTYADLPDADLVAVCDTDPDRARSAAAAHGAHSYANVGALLEAERPDAVSVATPLDGHYDAAAAALEAGAHALVEKPLAHTAEKAQALVELARGGDRVLAVGHLPRFNAAVDCLRRRHLLPGHLGSPVAITTSRFAPRPERLPGADIVYEQTIHDIDLARYLCGVGVKWATASLAGHTPGRPSQYALVELEMEDGTRVISEAGWGGFPPRREVRFVGTAGVAVMSLAEKALAGCDATGSFEYRFEGADAIRDELAEFVECARVGRVPRTPGEEGVANLAVIERLTSSRGQAGSGRAHGRVGGR
jgi:predicted dehydrogenase